MGLIHEFILVQQSELEAHSRAIEIYMSKKNNSSSYAYLSDGLFGYMADTLNGSNQKM